MTRFLIQSRRNDTLAVIDPLIDDYERMQCTLRFCGLSSFALTLRRESRFAKTFLPDINGNLNSGLLLFVDNEDGTPPVQLLNGPQVDFTLSRKADSTGTLLVGGASDEYWLQKRLALPCPHYPLIAFYSNSNFLAGPAGSGLTSAETAYGINSGQQAVSFLRYYPLLETVGTTATDYSFGATNGTYTGGFTQGQPGLVDDPNPCTLFNGSGYVSVPTTSLPTGNSSFTVFGWAMFSANPAGNAVVWAHGTNAAGEVFWMGINSSGQPISTFGSPTINGSTALALNIPHFFVATWNSATNTATFYVDNNVIGSQVFAALNIIYGPPAHVGAYLDGTSGWNGQLGHVGFCSGNLTPAMLTQMYVVGLSRHAYNSFDNNGGFSSYPGAPAADAPIPGKAFAAASTGLIYYVQRNASATASPYAGFGAAAPLSTFASALGTRYAYQVPNLVCASDGQVGGKVYAAARFDPTLTLLQAIAIQSNPEVGFRLVQVGQQLQFQTYLPVDRTATAIFSLDRANLRSYDWQYGRSTANYLITGGLNPSTSLQSRLFGEAGDATSIQQFGLIVDFYDYRKTSDTTTLANVMQARLVQLRAKRNINAVVNDTPALYFAGPGAKGYNLGDRVTVQQEDGTTYSDIVREVQIDLSPGQPAKVTAAIGTPIDAEILNELDAIYKRFRDDGISIDLLAQNY